MEEGEVCKRVFDLEYLFKGFNTLINKYSSSKDYVGKLKTEIIEKPTYVGIHPPRGGIEFIKKYDENIMVAVQVSKRDVLYLRSMYIITEDKVEMYLDNGSIKNTTINMIA